ncbi:MAG TPA: RluA family pseudouridine synthase [Actinomycetota bacterium]|nr:RluA family pseudouridine synthase [Actinomycetota bacterium]
MTVTVEVAEEDDGRRLDVVVAGAVGISRTRAGDLIAAGAVHVGGRAERKSYQVAAGDVLEITEPQTPAPPAPHGVDVLWEDDHLLVVAKPSGVVVHRAAGVRGGTLVDALIASGHRLASAPGPERRGIVHRLDRDVSGLLVVAKTDEAHAALGKAIRRRDVERLYLALVHGSPSVDRGKIDAPIGRNPRHRTRMAVRPEGRSSVTWFSVKERLTATALLEVRLETGRTHQIRTHLASIGHPIVGDAAYGRDPSFARSLGLRRPFLHAYRLAFDHPVTGERIDVRSDLPEDLQRALGTVRAQR